MSNANSSAAATGPAAAPADAGARISFEQAAHGGLLRLTSTIDIDAAKQLQAVAIEACAAVHSVQIDWSQAGHICPGAIQVLLALQSALAANGGTLGIQRDNASVRRLLEYAGLSGCFPAAAPDVEPRCRA